MRATLDFIEQRHGHLVLHAGAASRQDGRSVVVHGASGVGKTTLTAALVQSGLAYLTDETVCVDPRTLEIEPFPKPLTVKPGAQSLLAHLTPPGGEGTDSSGNWQISPHRLGGRAIPGTPLRPSLIVFPDVDPARHDVEVTPVSAARAAFVLGEQSSALWAIEPRPLAAIARLVGSAQALQVSYGSAFEAAPVIVEHLADAAPLDAVSVSVSVSDRVEPAPTGIQGPRRAKGVDWLLLGGEAVLFDGEHLHHLDGPGAAVWSGLAGQLSLPDLAGELAARFEADPHDILLDVEDLVRVLRSRGLVEGP